MGPIGPAQVGEWFDALAPALVLYARQWADAAPAEDVVQDVFVRLMSQRKAPANPKGWLFRCVRNAAISHLRWSSRRRRHHERLAAGGAAMAMGETLLFMPTVGGPPAGVYVKDPKRRPYGQPLWRGAFSATGMWVMTVGDDAVVGSADRQFVHHVATYNDLRQRLPVVTDEAIYLRDGHFLAAEKRSAYRVHRKRGWFTHAKSKLPKRVVKSPDPADVLWKARAGVQIEAVILAGQTLLSAGGGKIVASDAKTGRDLWSAPAGAEVTDLAFCAGRLFAVTAAGRVLCFQPAAPIAGADPRSP